jgi:hypothetical protein
MHPYSGTKRMNVRIEREINHTRIINVETGKEIVSDVFAWLIEKMEDAMKIEATEERNG